MARNLPIQVQTLAVDIWLLPSTIILFDQYSETAYLTNKEVILTGDFNINFLHKNSRNTTCQKV
jgi:hypothetical protein